MSLVGPRPLLVEYLQHYTPDQARRHDMRPGVTGWAAVQGRHSLRFEERLALDTWYVDHFSLWLDLKILAMTVSQVLRRSGVSTTQSVEDIGFPLAPPAPSAATPANPDGVPIEERDGGRR
jgi:lipopolysaccharide/colanic/teichoic acid biosynthesis glycosyltransferase